MREEIKNWLESGQKDAETARYNLDGNKLEAAAFFAQQATEKALKAGVNHIEEYSWRSYTSEQLRHFYENNLRWVIKEVKKLLKRLDGRFVVTADHGEAFGERGDFFHPLGTTNPAVRQVPYWESESQR